MLKKSPVLLCLLHDWLSLVSLLGLSFSAFSVLLKKCLLTHKLCLSCCFVCFIDGKNLDIVV